MIVQRAKNMAHGAKAGSSMNLFTDLTTGERIAFVRNRRKIKQTDFARMMGVNVIYISQVENDHRDPGRSFIRKAARILGTSIGFLERETDDPSPADHTGIDPLVYFSQEADDAARLIDVVPAEQRKAILNVVQAMTAQSATQAQPQQYQEPPLPEENKFARKLVESETASMFGRLIRA